MNKDFPYYLTKFLKEYIILERNLSDNTKRSYRNTFQILIDFLVNEKNYKITDITFAKVTKENITDFLNYLEEERHNSIRTRNQRLACIKAFYQFCLIDEVENISNIRKILALKSKKYPKKIVDYLTEEELKELLESVDVSNIKGRRNFMLLVLLYDTAARASEIIKLKVEDIHLEEKYVILDGKGKKERIVPIMEKTKDLILQYQKEFNIKNGYLFQNKTGNCMSCHFIEDLMYKYAKDFSKNITPHTFRHTRAIHLLSAGVSIIYLRDLLGHESVTTTEEYVKVLDEDKFNAIRSASPTIISDELDDWINDQDLLTQLLSL